MILDTSAIVSIVFREPDAPSLLEKLKAAQRLGLGSPTLVEPSVVIESRFGGRGRRYLSTFLSSFRIETLPFGHRHWQESILAFRLYGKGRHPARLNFGDCMSYATAKVAERPLLFVGGDFSQTDLESA